MAQIFFSERGIPLVFCGLQRCKYNHYLTVENYIKWYDIYVVDPEDNVKRLESHYEDEYLKINPESYGWGDHIPNPDFCIWLVNTYKYFEWDHPSYEMIIGRLVAEERINNIDSKLYSLERLWDYQRHESAK